jgi:hypothetical protein
VELGLHPNLVAVAGMMDAATGVRIVSYFDRREATLMQLLKKRQLDADRRYRITIACQAAAGLAQLHATNRAHGRFTADDVVIHPRKDALVVRCNPDPSPDRRFSVTLLEGGLLSCTLIWCLQRRWRCVLCVCRLRSPTTAL